MTKTAIILFNLGGPDQPSAVRPFLFNLFNDPAIIGAPAPIRLALAWFLSARRAPVARKIYDHLGGGSPILPNTQAQANALEQALGDVGSVRCFIAMRYWQPRAAEVAQEVKAFGPDRIVLLPLYPQFSTTTSASSLAEWAKAAKAQGLGGVPSWTIGCYPHEQGFAQAAADLIAPALDRAASAGAPRLLLSAHGLPKKIVDAGDPYQFQVEQSAAAILAALNRPDLDSVICYQSRVGPLEWIGPSTDSEIRRAGMQGKPLVIFPIAFVSDHSETLVELEIECRELAMEQGVPLFERVAAVGDHPAFIAGLAGLVRAALVKAPGIVTPLPPDQLCPAGLKNCHCRKG